LQGSSSFAGQFKKLPHFFKGSSTPLGMDVWMYGRTDRQTDERNERPYVMR
jgi:hypothetical protein